MSYTPPPGEVPEDRQVSDDGKLSTATWCAIFLVIGIVLGQVIVPLIWGLVKTALLIAIVVALVGGAVWAYMHRPR